MLPRQLSKDPFLLLFQLRYVDSRSPSGIDFSSAKMAAYFGTHAVQCHISDLIWRLGPSCLLEDPLTDEAINTMYRLGPSYSGCFQAPVVSEHYEVRTCTSLSGSKDWPMPLSCMG